MKKKTFFYLIFSILFLVIFFTQNIHARNLSEEDQLIQVGIGAFNDGFYEIAEKQFSYFLKNYSNHGKVYHISYLLGKTLLIKGKLKEAKTVYYKILKEYNEFEYQDHTLFWLATIELKLGNLEEANRLLSSLIRRFPKFEWIDYSYYLLGYLDFGSNKIIQAESSFKKVPFISKNKELIRSSFLWLGILSFKQSKYESATEYFQTIWEDPKYISQEYLKYALFWLGESKLKLGRFNDAKSYYKTFYERFRNDPLIPEIYWKIGLCEYRLGNIKESIEIFQAFKNQFKDSPLILYTHYFLGEIFQAIGDYSSSIKELNSITMKLQGSIFWGISFLNLYWNHIHLGDWDGANKVYQRLQKLNHFEDEKIFTHWLNAEMMFAEGKVSDSLPYYFNILNTTFREKALFRIGKGYYFENKFREAITNLDLLYLEFPNSEYLEESSFIKGECLSKLGNFPSAIETYNLILRQNRKNHWELFALIQAGSIYLSQKENDYAEYVFRRVIDHFPNHPLSYHAAFQMGNLYLKKKNIVEAIHYYSMVLKGNILELFGEAHFGLGEVFYQQGKYEKAFASFEAAMKYFQENSLCFFLTQLEIGNLQMKFGKYEEAKKSFRIVSEQSKDEEIKKAAKELLKRIEPK